MTLPFFTIGHSTRSIAEFAALLAAGPAELVVDVRTMPRSRANPQFNLDLLGEALAPYGVGYRRIEALGGLRKRAAEVPPEINGWWDNRSFHNYADYALSDGLRRRARGAHDARPGAAHRDNVRRSGLVALPPADHRRLSAASRRAGLPPDGQRSGGTGADDPGGTGEVRSLTYPSKRA